MASSHARRIVVWGTGTPCREFLYVDDLAEAVWHLMERYSGEEIVNVGTGEDVTIAELAALIREVVGYRGRLSFDATKPDGTPRKLLNVARLHALGFRATTSLREGLERTYGWFVAHARDARGLSAGSRAEAVQA